MSEFFVLIWGILARNWKDRRLGFVDRFNTVVTDLPSTKKYDQLAKQADRKYLHAKSDQENGEYQDRTIR